jgi:hypothetical protein
MVLPCIAQAAAAKAGVVISEIAGDRVEDRAGDRGQVGDSAADRP